VQFERRKELLKPPNLHSVSGLATFKLLGQALHLPSFLPSFFPSSSLSRDHGPIFLRSTDLLLLLLFPLSLAQADQKSPVFNDQHTGSRSEYLFLFSSRGPVLRLKHLLDAYTSQIMRVLTSDLILRSCLESRYLSFASQAPVQNACTAALFSARQPLCRSST
jgi:hypothetical protein